MAGHPPVAGPAYSVMMAVAAKWYASLGATGDHDGAIAF